MTTYAPFFRPDVRRPKIRTHFSKIFLWYWVAMAAVGAVALLVTVATQPDSDEANRRSRVAAALDFYRGTAASEYEKAGSEALQAYLNHLRRTGGMNAWFFSAQGQELSGNPIKREARRLMEEIRKSQPQPDRGTGAAPESSSNAVQSPLADGKPPRYGGVVWHSTRQSTLGAKMTHSPQGTPYWLLVELPHEAEYRNLSWLIQGLRAPISTHIVRWLTLLAASGLVCFGLARYLVAPLMQLSGAVHRFSSGDLQARVGPALGNRQDEIADLGRDFDHMAERIETLVQSQHRLLGDISHELRSPLTRLGVAQELAQHHVAKGDLGATQDALERIGTETARLDSLIDQLLTLVRLETGDALLQKTTVNLNQLVQEVVTDADFEASSRGRHVHLVGAMPCAIEGYPELLHSAIENVVRNGVYYTAQGTGVEVSLQSNGLEGGERKVLLTIEDHGPGVPDEELASLFRPFYRVMTPGLDQSRGTGLGLAITYRAVEAHAGKCWAENKPDGGLKVSLELPV